MYDTYVTEESDGRSRKYKTHEVKAFCTCPSHHEEAGEGQRVGDKVREGDKGSGMGGLGNNDEECPFCSEGIRSSGEVLHRVEM